MVRGKSNFDLGRFYFSKGNFSRALIYLHKENRARRGNKDVLSGIANCYLQLRDYENAIKALERILKIDATNDKFYFRLGLVYMRAGSIEGAIMAFEQAININPHEVNYHLQLADVYEKTNEHEKALKVIFQGLTYFPNSSPLQISAAKSERRLGKYKESLERLENLRSQGADLPPHWKLEYDFELGFVYDQGNNADLAFHHFTKANSTVRSLPEYQKVDTYHSLDLIRNLGELDFGNINKIINFSKNNPPQVQPVFFVGFPRSGTTLLQKVLDSHHDIQVIEENNPLGRVTSLIESEPEKYLKGSFLLNTKNIKKLQAMYFSEAKKYVSIDDGSVIVDKLPMNIVQVPIIKILFPGAKILLGLRHPCDCILSCYMQNFGVNRAMANMFEFDSIINFYDKTMGLWKVFQNEVDFESYATRYEDLIENMEEEVRSILQFLDLPWDEDVLSYRQNTFKRGLINTPSYGQVVKPIYKEARYRWHRYAKYFEPSYEKLRPHCEAFGYSLTPL